MLPTTRSLPATLSALSIILLLAISVFGAQGKKSVRIQPEEYLQSLKTHVTSMSPTGFEFEFESLNEPGVVPNGMATLPILIAVPSGSSCELTLVEGTWECVPDYGVLEAGLALDATTETGLRYASANTFLRASSTDDFRSIGVARAQINVSHTPERTTRVGEAAGGNTAILRRGKFIVTFKGGSIGEETVPAPEDLPRIDPFLIEFTKGFFLNDVQVPQVSRDFQPDMRDALAQAWNEMLIRAAARAPLVQMKVTKPGIYEIRAQDLISAGIPAEKFDLASIRAFMGSEEIALLCSTANSGPFSGDTSVIFFVPEERFDLEPWKPIWLLQDPEAPTQPRRWRLDSDRVPARDTGPARLRRSYTLFEPNKFSPQSPLDSPMLRWVTAEIPADESMKWEMPVVGLSGDPRAELELTFSGRQPQETQTAEIFLNLQRLGERKMQGKSKFIHTEEIPAGLLKEGKNILALRYAADPSPAPGFVNGATLPFVMASLKYDSDTEGLQPEEFAELTSLGTPPPARLRIRVRAAANDGPVLVLQVRKDRALTFQHAMQVEREAESLFETAIYDPRQGDSIVYASKSSFLRPYSIATITPPRSWSQSSPVSYLAIIWDGLLNDLQPLLDYRKSRGELVDVLTVDDIYNAFSYGYKDYDAIRLALRHALIHRGAPRLRSVVMVGEASEYWWELSKPNTANAMIDRVPAYGWRNPDVTIRGDDSYTHLIGDGPWSDVEVGRISVNSGEELRQVINRIITYETARPGGGWLGRHLFVADDEPEFTTVAEKIIQTDLGLGTLPERLYLGEQIFDNYPRIRGRKRSTEATAKLIDALSRSALFVSYYGHGGPNVWSHERMLHLRDIPFIENEGRESVLLVASCDTAWIDYPTDPVKESIGELLLRSKNAGSIAVWAPIAGTSSFEHRFVLGRFYEGLYHYDQRRIGTLTLHSKLGYLLDRSTPYVANQYILLGDPGLRIPDISGGVEISIDTPDPRAVPDERVEVSGRVRGVSRGFVELTLLDKERKPADQTRRVELRGGRFAATIVLSDEIVPGTYHLHVSAWDKGLKKTYVDEIPVFIRPLKLNAEWIEPDMTALPGSQVQAYLRVTNEEKTGFSGLRINVRDRVAQTLLGASVVEIGAGQTKEFLFPLTVANELQEIEATLFPAWDANQVFAPILDRRLRIMGIEDASRKYVVNASTLAIQRSENSSSTRIILPVENRSSETTPPNRVTLYRLDGEVEAIVDASKGIPALGPRETADLVFITSGKITPGKMDMRLDVTKDDGATTVPIERIPFPVTIPNRIDLGIVSGSFQPTSAKTYEGETVFFDLAVVNFGDVTVNRYRVNLFRDAPWEAGFRQGSEVESNGTNLPPLHPGQSTRFKLRMDPNADITPGSRRIWAGLELLDGLKDVDKENNVALAVIEVLQGSDLAVEPDEATQSTRFVVPGQVVQLAVPFRNTSDVAFDFPVTLSAKAEGPFLPSEQLFFQQIDTGLRPGSGGLAQFNWVVKPGQNRVRFMLNEELEYPESSIANNEYTFRFDRVLSPASDERIRKPSMADLVEFGDLTDLYRSPNDTMQIVPRPAGESQYYDGLANYVTAKANLGMPNSPDASDDLYSPVGTDKPYLANSATENPVPVVIRVPVEPRGTNLFDVYLTQRGSLVGDNVPSGDFNYRFGIQESFKTKNRAPAGQVYLGRTYLKEDFFELHISGSGTPSRNEFYAITLSPVKGSYTCMPMSIEGLTPVRIASDVTLPRTSRVEFHVQYGQGTMEEPVWGEWLACGFGGRFPAAPSGTKFMRWRVNLLGGKDGLPIINSLRPDYGTEPEETLQ